MKYFDVLQTLSSPSQNLAVMEEQLAVDPATASSGCSPEIYQVLLPFLIKIQCQKDGLLTVHGNAKIPWLCTFCLWFNVFFPRVFPFASS